MPREDVGCYGNSYLPSNNIIIILIIHWRKNIYTRGSSFSKCADDGMCMEGIGGVPVWGRGGGGGGEGGIYDEGVNTRRQVVRSGLPTPPPFLGTPKQLNVIERGKERCMHARKCMLF